MENTVNNYEAVWWFATSLLLAAAMIAVLWFALRERTTRWCVYIEGPDEMECHESREAAERRVADLNAFFAANIAPRSKDQPPIFAKVVPSPYDTEDHDREVARCREAWEKERDQRNGLSA